MSIIRRERQKQNEIEYIRECLITDENSGICEQTPQEIIAEIKAELGENGKLQNK
jgi:hypothetical protein